MPFDEGADITVRTSVTEDMMLSAAFTTCCKQPGFTMARTYLGEHENFVSENHKSYEQFTTSSNSITDWKIYEANDHGNMKYPIEIYLQFLDTAHVVLVFDAQTYWLGIGTRTIKLERSGVSVDIIHQEFGCILPQQSA